MKQHRPYLVGFFIVIVLHVIVDFYRLTGGTFLLAGDLYWLLVVHLTNKTLFGLFVLSICYLPYHLFFRTYSIRSLYGLTVFLYLSIFWLQFLRYNLLAAYSVFSPVVVGTVIAVLLVGVGLSSGAAMGLQRIHRRVRSGLLALVLIVSLILPYGMAYQPEPPGTVRGNPPNIIFFMIDTLHADHLSTYGYDRPTAPNLTEFAEDATLFERAYAPSNWTKPSVASIFSGLYPVQHRTNTARSALPRRAETLAEILNRVGYRTMGVSTNSFVSPFFGFNQGFQRFELLKQSRLNDAGTFQMFLRNVEIDFSPIPYDGTNDSNDAGTVNRLGLNWLTDRTHRRPVFLYLHYMDPHDPYNPPADHLNLMEVPDGYDFDRIKKKYLPRQPRVNVYPFHRNERPPSRILDQLVYQYDAEIRYWDHEFGGFLDRLRKRNLLEDSIVIVTADHGEEFFQHANWSHGTSLFEENIRVPLIIDRSDGDSARTETTVRRPVNLVDLFPWLLRRASGPGSRIEEKPLGNPTADTPTLENTVYASRVQQADVSMHSLLWYPWKFVRIEKNKKRAERLYNLELDPAEQDDRKSERPNLASTLRQLMDSKIRRTRRHTTHDSRKRRLSPELQNQLEGLGYM